MARAKRKTGQQSGTSPQARPYRESNSLTPQQELAEISHILPGQVPVSERVRELARGELYQGPIPHPDIFKGYGEVIPDAPERILRVFEQDSAHARDIQNAALRLQQEDNRRVHWMAYSLIAGGYMLAGFFAYLDKDTLAIAMLCSTLAGTIASFFQQKSVESRNKDRH